MRKVEKRSLIILVGEEGTDIEHSLSEKSIFSNSELYYFLKVLLCPLKEKRWRK